MEERSKFVTQRGPEVCDKRFLDKLQSLFSMFDELPNRDRKQFLKSVCPKIIVHGDFRIEMKVNPIFYKEMKPLSIETGVDENSSKKWLVGSRSSELFTPPAFLTDIIEFSGIRPEEDLSSLLEKYQENGLSLRQITALSVHSRDRITERLKEAGVEIRGNQRSGSVKVKPYDEADIGQMVKSLRNKGQTYRQIAQKMTSIKVRSKNGKLKWHPMMVKRSVSEMCRFSTEKSPTMLPDLNGQFEAEFA